MAAIQDQDMIQVSYAYNPLTQQEITVDGDGNVTTNTYDGDDLMSQVTTDGSPLHKIISSLTYTYDADGQVTSTTDGDGTTTDYEYQANRLVGEAVWQGSALLSSMSYGLRRRRPPGVGHR